MPPYFELKWSRPYSKELVITEHAIFPLPCSSFRCRSKWKAYVRRIARLYVLHRAWSNSTGNPVHNECEFSIKIHQYDFEDGGGSTNSSWMVLTSIHTPSVPWVEPTRVVYLLMNKTVLIHSIVAFPFLSDYNTSCLCISSVLCIVE